MRPSSGLGVRASLALALVVYFGLLGLVFLRLSSERPLAVKYSELKDNYINIELAQPSPQPIPQPSPRPSPAPQKPEPDPAKSPPQISPQTSPQISPQTSPVDIAELFAKTTPKPVRTEEIQQRATRINELFGSLKEPLEEKTDKVQSSAKSALATARAKLGQKLAQNKAALDKALNSLRLIELNASSGGSMSRGVYDEFLGRVSRTITSRWARYYPEPQASVLVKIIIHADGSFDYGEVERSFNPSYDAKVAAFLAAQRGKFIAYPPEGVAVSITMQLRDEAKGAGEEDGDGKGEGGKGESGEGESGAAGGEK